MMGEAALRSNSNAVNPGSSTLTRALRLPFAFRYLTGIENGTAMTCSPRHEVFSNILSTARQSGLAPQITRTSCHFELVYFPLDEHSTGRRCPLRCPCSIPVSTTQGNARIPVPLHDWMMKARVKQPRVCTA
jgi:hypothetical protein